MLGYRSFGQRNSTTIEDNETGNIFAYVTREIDRDFGGYVYIARCEDGATVDAESMSDLLYSVKRHYGISGESL